MNDKEGNHRQYPQKYSRFMVDIVGIVDSLVTMQQGVRTLATDVDR